MVFWPEAKWVIYEQAEGKWRVYWKAELVYVAKY